MSKSKGFYLIPLQYSDWTYRLSIHPFRGYPWVAIDRVFLSQCRQ